MNHFFFYLRRHLMLAFVALLTITFVSVEAQQSSSVPPLKSLTVGNRFFYNRWRGVQTTSFYEIVLRDTLVGSRQYAVLYSSLDSTVRLERSDDNALYVLDGQGQEKVALWFMQRLRSGDTIAGFSLYSIGNANDRYRVGIPERIQNGTQSIYSLPMTSLSASSTEKYLLQYASPLGMTGWQRIIAGKAGRINGISFRGAVIDGAVYGDTTLPVVSPPAPPIENISAKTVAAKTTSLAAPSNTNNGLIFAQVPSTASNGIAAPMTFSYTLPSQNRVQIFIFDGEGKNYISSLVEQTQAKGDYIISWNGKTYRGAMASKGEYVALLVLNGQEARRLRIVKE